VLEALAQELAAEPEPAPEKAKEALSAGVQTAKRNHCVAGIVLVMKLKDLIAARTQYNEAKGQRIAETWSGWAAARERLAVGEREIYGRISEAVTQGCSEVAAVVKAPAARE
jgi:hypothetical protein